MNLNVIGPKLGDRFIFLTCPAHHPKSDLYGKDKTSSYCDYQAFYALLMKKCVNINNETELHFRGECGKGGDTRITRQADG